MGRCSSALETRSSFPGASVHPSRRGPTKKARSTTYNISSGRFAQASGKVRQILQSSFKTFSLYTYSPIYFLGPLYKIIIALVYLPRQQHQAVLAWRQWCGRGGDGWRGLYGAWRRQWAWAVAATGVANEAASSSGGGAMAMQQLSNEVPADGVPANHARKFQMVAILPKR